MNLALSELLQTIAVVIIAFGVLTALALFLKAESANWKKPSELKP